MFSATLSRLRCPKCRGGLKLPPGAEASTADILSGALDCPKCRTAYPILAGVAVLVEPVEEYLCAHAKGISKLVKDSEIPKQYRRAYQEALQEMREMGPDHIEEDLESDRVNALYLMNHYIATRDLDFAGPDPMIREWVAKVWDKGPLEEVAMRVAEIDVPGLSVVEQGCGVGGLARRIFQKKGDGRSYLGVDSSFASIALARHLNLGAPYGAKIQYPADLIEGVVSKAFPKILPLGTTDVDFVVGDLSVMPVQVGSWDVAVSMNAIDMLENPNDMPKSQAKLLKPKGIAIQTGPYIWHPEVAKNLRAQFPKAASDSATMVKELYLENGFELAESRDQIPWLFFKHHRQIELYSVHLLVMKKKG
ncbi:MAG: methyltransferase domain-containing protein [Bdellovibrionales bacterium]|nr:methyltransferase domain-containing protein [Bdellovibrionales bacterium]